MSAFKFQWVPHNGGPMPVSAETLVEVRHRYQRASGARWSASWVHWETVMAYRVVEVRP